ncbi:MULTISPECIES: VanZ family protein [Halocynthiibacter]|uniref:VanZ family protein n=1 Tax=Halocynthiibacter halioticoli TaxID=2986804 RepID=A0AAE3J4J9_9RHOB|nr:MULTISPECIES: VanZ family protein [Halocynthiibacter]MCV6825827.1 VanZ family protein [Halocynthiibacter halioticoli]MCW4058828.1 VanZ family protein [Halocynthiibacter sp. SDUM655004]
MYFKQDTGPARKQRRAFVIWATVVLGCVIALLTLMPVSVPKSLPGDDKLYHMLAFFGLTLPCAVIYPRALVRVVLAAVLYGALIELIQPTVGRSREMADLIADTTGVFLGAAIGWPLHHAFIAYLRKKATVRSDT